VFDCGAHTLRRAALLYSLNSTHLLTDEPTVDAASAERQCCNFVKECRGIAPTSDCISNGGIKGESRPAERTAHDANIAKRCGRWARPERATHLSGNAFGCLLRNSDANTTGGTTNIYTSCKVHEPCANHRSHPIVSPRDNRDASRQTKVTRCRGTQRSDSRPREYLWRECALIESPRFTQQECTVRRRERARWIPERCDRLATQTECECVPCREEPRSLFRRRCALAQEPARLGELREQPAGSTEQRREARVIIGGATIAPEQRSTRRAPIFSHWYKRWAVAIGGDSENLNRRPSYFERFADRRSNRLPPDVWILFNGAACRTLCNAACTTGQSEWAAALCIKDEDLDRGAAEVNREECAARGSHCAAAARTARRFSVGRRCGRC
jgi:hypothetical protein